MSRTAKLATLVFVLVASMALVMLGLHIQRGLAGRTSRAQGQTGSFVLYDADVNRVCQGFVLQNKLYTAAQCSGQLYVRYGDRMLAVLVRPVGPSGLERHAEVLRPYDKQLAEIVEQYGSLSISYLGPNRLDEVTFEVDGRVHKSVIVNNRVNSSGDIWLKSPDRGCESIKGSLGSIIRDNEGKAYATITGCHPDRLTANLVGGLLR